MFKENVPLSRFSHYKIGGPAAFFFAAKDIKEIRWAVQEAKKKKLPIFVLGGGTNLLISDKGFRGLVLKPEVSFIKEKKGRVIEAGAGTPVADLLDFTVLRGLSGLEWAGGLPGSVGGAVRGNAGCFGGEMKDSIRLVRSFDMRTGKVREWSAKECRFGYRASIFKKAIGRNEVILSATFQMKKGDPKTIARAIREKIRYRKERQPIEHPSIGSMFKNIPLANIYARGSNKYKMAVAAGALSYRGSLFSVKNDPFPVISVAKMLSEAGLKGVSCGGAMISPKHPNFFVNVLQAGSGDVERLIVLARQTVKKRFGVDLEAEIQMV